MGNLKTSRPPKKFRNPSSSPGKSSENHPGIVIIRPLHDWRRLYRPCSTVKGSPAPKVPPFVANFDQKQECLQFFSDRIVVKETTIQPTQNAKKCNVAFSGFDLFWGGFWCLDCLWMVGKIYGTFDRVIFRRSFQHTPWNISSQTVSPAAEEIILSQFEDAQIISNLYSTDTWEALVESYINASNVFQISWCKSTPKMVDGHQHLYPNNIHNLKSRWFLAPIVLLYNVYKWVHILPCTSRFEGSLPSILSPRVQCDSCQLGIIKDPWFYLYKTLSSILISKEHHSKTTQKKKNLFKGDSYWKTIIVSGLCYPLLN